ncbi:MAG: hypothetical protein JSU04_00145 [Bdellovibrionales bacterium]|jgi:hypothetical protein|nr:hypothetical protein [Bdellovibrionales bacterium]
MIRGIGFIKVKYRVVDNEYFCRDYEGAEAAEEAAERLIEDKLAEGVTIHVDKVAILQSSDGFKTCATVKEWIADYDDDKNTREGKPSLYGQDYDTWARFVEVER